MAIVYISYGEETRRKAETLRFMLEERKLQTWMFAGDLAAGMKLELQTQVLRDSACAVLVVPGEAIPGKGEPALWMEKELALARDNGVPLILVPAERLVTTAKLGILFDHITVNHLVPVPMPDWNAPYNSALLDQITGLVRRKESGSILRMGRWPAERSGPAEEIEWYILAEEGDKLLLLSRFGLETKPFSTRKARTWDDCSLRRWLNEDFLQTAFSQEEQRSILETRVTPDPNPDYDTYPGEACTDRLFVLSLSEFREYLGVKGEELRCCLPTPRAKWQGAFAWNDRICLWWLRTPGNHDNQIIEINAGGGCDTKGVYAQRDEVCVRPAMWVSKTLLPREE